MLEMVFDGTFHKTYDRGLLGNVSRKKKHFSDKVVFFS